MKLFLFVAFFLSNIAGNAQAPQWAWIKTNNGDGFATVNGIAATADGGFYTIGRLTDSVRFGNVALHNPGRRVVIHYLAKFTAAAVCQWIQPLGGYNPPISPFHDGPYINLAVDDASNAYVTMQADTVHLPDTTLPGPGCIIKFGLLGQRAWIKRTPNWGFLAVEGRSVYWGTGSSTPFLLDGITITPTNSQGDMAIFRFNTEGVVQWGKRFGGPRWESISNIAVNSQGVIYINGGYADSTDIGGIKLSEPGGGSYLAQLDSNGVVQWANKELCAGMGFTPGGKIVSHYRVNTTSTGFRVFNPDGTPILSRTICLEKSFPSAFCTAPNGDFVMAFLGRDSLRFGSYVFRKPTNVQMPAYAGVLGIVRVDSTGNIVWAKGIPTAFSSYDRINGLSCDTAGNVYAVGQASEYSDFDGTIISTPLGLAGFIAKTGAVTAMPPTANPANFKGLSIAPNPATGATTVRWENGRYTSLHIVDAAGRVIHTQPLRAGKKEADISLQGYAPGVYFIHLEGQADYAAGRVVVQP